jgi:hypothetical protein
MEDFRPVPGVTVDDGLLQLVPETGLARLFFVLYWSKISSGEHVAHQNPPADRQPGGEAQYLLPHPAPRGGPSGLDERGDL